MSHPLTKRHRPLAAAMILAGTLAFVLIAADVHWHGLLQQGDMPILNWCKSHEHLPLLFACMAFTSLGELNLIIAEGLILGLYLFRRRLWRELLIWIVALVGSAVLNESLKNYFHLPRPTGYLYGLYKRGGYTFPSGHTMGATIAIGAAALILMRVWNLPTRKRCLIALVVAAIATLVAATLLYIRVHYLTDVLAALAVSTAWLGVILWWLERKPWLAKHTNKTSQPT